MNLSCLLSLLKKMPAYRQLVGELSAAKGEHKATVLDAAKPYFIAALYKELDLPLMVVTGQPETARKLHERTTRPALFFDRRLMHNFALKDILPLMHLPEF